MCQRRQNPHKTSLKENHFTHMPFSCERGCVGGFVGVGGWLHGRMDGRMQGPPPSLLLSRRSPGELILTTVCDSHFPRLRRCSASEVVVLCWRPICCLQLHENVRICINGILRILQDVFGKLQQLWP